MNKIIELYQSKKIEPILIHLILFFLLSSIPLMAQDYLQQTSGPEGGEIRDMVVKDIVSDILIFAVHRGGVSVYSRNERLWRQTSLTDISTSCIAINADGEIFVGTYGQGVFYSLDNGERWTDMSGELPNKNIYDLKFNWNNDLLVGTYGDGVFITSNNGNTWNSISNGYFTHVLKLAVDRENEILYASAPSEGIYRSMDTGATWINIGPVDQSIYAIIPDARSNYLFAGTSADGIYRSGDHGDSWDLVNSTIFNSRDFIVNTMGQIFVCAEYDGGIHRSPDKGLSWGEVSEGLLIKDVLSLAITPTNEIFAGTDGAGVFLSIDDGDTWNPEKSGLINSSILSLAIDNQDRIYAGTMGTGVMYSDDQGQNWIQSPGSINMPNVRALVFHKDYGTIFAATQGGYVYRSNNGLTWQQVSQGMDNGYVFSLAINYSNAYVYAATQGGGLYRMPDDGTDWTPVSGSWQDDPTIHCIAIGETGIMFVSTGSHGVHRSLNNGSTWQPVNTGLPEGPVYSMAIDSDGMVYAGIYGGGVYYSKDNGLNWIAVTDGLSDWTMAYNVLAINEFNHVFLATMFSGVFRLTDFTGSWTNVSEDLIHKTSYSLALDSQGFLYMGSLGGGVYRTVKSTTAASANFSVKMLYVEGFNPSVDQVGVQGNFNNWGSDGEYPILTPVADADLTYNGKWNTNRADTISTGGMGGLLEYQYVYLEIDTAVSTPYPESFYRSVEWDGKEDLTTKTHWFSQVENNPEDSLILADLYNSTNGDNWTNKTNWLSNHPFREWHGINAAGGRVVEIALSQNNLNGPLPESIGDLTELLTLFMEVNNLQGNLPESIGNLVNLSGLILSSNNFTGVLPDTFTNLTNIKYLLLGDNQFSGSLPSSVYQLTKLSELKIGNNQFSGVIDPQITNLNTLQSLWLVGNQFTDLPDLTSLGNLSSVYVQNNKFTFEDIEPNISLPGFEYSPQDSVGVPKDTTMTEGASLNLKVTVGGENNQYQWYLDGSIIDGATTNSYMIASMAASHVGEYHCAITNTVVTDLTIWSHPVTVSILATPEKPVLSSPANGATEVATNPVLSWNPVSGADSFRIQLDDNSEFSSLILDMNGITQTSYQLSDLNENTTYHWRVNATNAYGTSDWSDPWYFTTKSPSALTPPTLMSPSDGQMAVEINPTLSWNSSTSGTFHLQLDKDMAFNPPEMKFSGLTNSSYQVNALDFNTTYYWRVNVGSAGDSSDWSLIWDFTTMAYPSQVDVNTTMSFPSHDRQDEFSASDYRLFGIPGNHDTMLESIIGSGAGEQWRAYWDNGNSSDYFVIYDSGKNDFKCVTGRAFWILYNGSLNVNQNVTSAPLNNQKEAEIQLHNGWNLITNPFSFDIDWSQVQDVNTVTQPIWSFTGSWSQANALKPYEGYYFENRNNLPILKIPYTATPVGKAFAYSESDWQVTITLISNDKKDSSSRFGVSQYAEKGLDELDFVKPRTVGELPSVYFYRPQWDHDYKIFASDIRPKIEEIERWEFMVLSPNKNEVELAFSGLEAIPKEFKVYLIDKLRLSSIDLRDIYKHRFIPAKKISDFEIVIGREELVDAHLKTIIPQEYGLGTNYPNPFNPSTTIPVIIAQDSDIELKIYNLLGQEVKNLYQGSLNTGKHYFVWDGRDNNDHRLSSGIYLYRLSYGKGGRLVGKMVMLK